MAHVVDCQPMDLVNRLAAGREVDRRKFLGLEACPKIGYKFWACTLPNSRETAGRNRDDKGRAHDQAVPSLKSYARRPPHN